MKRLFVTVTIVTLFALSVFPYQVNAAVSWFTDGIGVKRAINSAFQTIESTSDSTQYYLHNGGSGDKLEFAVREGSSGPTHWQVLNINRNGDVHLGYDQDTVNFTVNGPATFKTSLPNWAVTAKHRNIDVRLGFDDGYGIFVRSDNVTGRYLLQLNNGGTAVFQVDTNGRTRINNTLYAKEIRVTNTPWADYVFSENYYLNNLTEIEAFISQNKHLPGIPSGEDIQANGISVNEMLKLQMEKIEELTLHLIQKDKEIKSLQSEVAIIKAKLGI